MCRAIADLPKPQSYAITELHPESLSRCGIITGSLAVVIMPTGKRRRAGGGLVGSVPPSSQPASS